ncbi:hypothetical protein CLV90_0130 [Maribacter spongiicola]|uniref:Uncharacterized protein n=1 Tax=Maribacter spongiicola TaxID=1206753 RepID=A0A4R7K8L5_9FLAO|nr:hypothetical protein CLV90_0130 [Maribacter spongiicola]
MIFPLKSSFLTRQLMLTFNDIVKNILSNYIILKNFIRLFLDQKMTSKL